MTYSTNNFYLAVFLLCKKCTFLNLEQRENEIYFNIEYKNNSQLEKLIKDYFTFNAKVNMDKYKQVQELLESEISKLNK